AITRHLVEIHGGAVRAESEGDGQGSTFSVSLPMVVATATGRDDQNISPDSTTVSADSGLQGLHILLVDDDVDTLEMIKTAFGKLQASVSTATSTNEAI